MRHSFVALLRIALVGIVMIGMLEYLAQSGWSRQNLATPSRGFNDDTFDVQIDYLDKMLEQNGKIDCIIVGNSIVGSSFLPSIIAQGYADYAPDEKTLECFNFGRWGMHNDMLVELTKILIDKYNPRYIIYGINPDIFGEPTEPDQSLKSSEWFQYMQGTASMQGWLIEHSLFYRYALRYQSWHNPNFTQLIASAQNTQTIYDEDGYRGLSFRSIDVRYPANSELPEQETFKQYIEQYDTAWEAAMSNYRLTPARTRSAIKLLELANYNDTKLIILDMPIHPSFLEFFADGEAQYDKYLEDVQALTENYDVVYWQLKDIDFLPDEFWFDRHHLHVGGGYLLSYWLGAQLAGAISADFTGETLHTPPIANVDIPSVDLYFAEFWNPSTDLFKTYENSVDQFTFWADGSVFFNPNAEHENIRNLQMNILLSYPYGIYDHEALLLHYKHFYYLEQVRTSDELNLDETQMHYMDKWFETYQPNFLYGAGIDYLIYNMYWFSTLAPEAQETLQNPNYYKPIGIIAHPRLGSTFIISRPIFQPEGSN